MNFKLIIIVFLFFVFKPNLFCQTNSVDIYNDLKKLNFLGSIIYMAAHPDDENTALLSYFSNQKLATTGYLSLTRGGGGQNLIGDNLKEKLGVIRTQELYAARKIDGAIQFFSSAKDFGFSKNPNETFSIWNKQKVLNEIIKTFNFFQPDIIINRFDHRTPGTTHGHHTASAILSIEAFNKINNFNKKNRAWAIERIFLNTSWFFYGSRKKFEELNKENLLSIDVGTYNREKGIYNSYLSARSRSQHKSQGFGSSPSFGSNLNYLEHIAGSKPLNNDPFYGINTTWTRLKGGLEIKSEIDKIIKSFNFLNPQLIVDDLLKVYKKISLLDQNIWKKRKLVEVKKIIESCIGLTIQVNSSVPYITENSKLDTSIKVIHQSNKNIILKSISFGDYTKEFNKKLKINNLLIEKSTFFIKNNLTTSSSSSWLLTPGSKGNYNLNSDVENNLTSNRNDLKVRFEILINGEKIDFFKQIEYRKTDPVKGEIVENLNILPKITVNFESDIYIFKNNEIKTVEVEVNNHDKFFDGKIGLQVPEGWTVEPKSMDLKILGIGNSTKLKFKISPDLYPKQGFVKPLLIDSVNKNFPYSLNIINHQHIPKQYVLIKSEAKLVPISISTPKFKVAYIPGAGDKIPESLSQVDIKVEKLLLNDLNIEQLKKYKSLILGIRIFNIEDDLKYKKEIIWEYVKSGGNLIIQYNTSRGLKTKEISPIKLNLSRDRVTNENSEVRILDKDHPILNYPNKISYIDFNDWIQERGLYFANDWGVEFQPILSMNDNGEDEKLGSLLIGKYGKGKIIYTGLSFFRQLPAGIPGAYKLFVNLISQ